MNEIQLLNVLENEEQLKRNILSKKELDIYKVPTLSYEDEIIKNEVKNNIKKFNDVSVETLTKMATVKTKTQRLFNILSDDDYKEHVKDNMYNFKNISKYDINMIVEKWLLSASVINPKGTNLHLCFDTESCETFESSLRTKAFIDEFCPGYNENNATAKEVKNFNDLCKEHKLIKDVRIYSWSLGCVCSNIQIYGETLEEFEKLINIILEFVPQSDRKIKNKLVGKSVSLMIDVHNLAWDLEFLKYHFRDNNVKHWYSKTCIDEKRSYKKLVRCDNSIGYKTEKIEIFKTSNEKQPGKSYSVVMGKGQTYMSTWELDDIIIDVIRKNKVEKMELRRKVTFFDMHKKVPMPLKHVADLLIIDKNFNKKSDEFDYKKVRKENEKLSELELQYQYNDVYIMTKYLEQIYYNRGCKGSTASSIAFNELLNNKYKNVEGEKYKNGFMEHFPKLIHSSTGAEIRNFYRAMYGGGFTSGVKQFEGELIDGIIISIDINSAYPYQMRYAELPFGKPYYGNGKFEYDEEKHKGKKLLMQRVLYDAFERKGKGINKNGVGFGFIQLLDSKQNVIKKDIKIDGIRYTGRERPYKNFDDDNKILIENFESYWTLETEKFMLETHNFYHYKRVKKKLKNGDVIELKTNELVEGVYYKDYIVFDGEKGYFGDFIDEYTSQKQIGKMLGNVGLTYMSKMYMNSCSGKLGSNYLRENNEIFTDDRGLIRNKKALHDREYEDNKEYFVPYIAFITAYTRLMLMEIIYKLECEFGFDSMCFQGCDTDSLYLKIPYKTQCNTVNKMIDYIKTLGIKLDAIQLGCWDIEKIIFKYKNLGSKKMMMHYRELKDIDKDLDIKKYLDLYNRGLLEYKSKVTCAGLPDLTRAKIEKLGFEHFSKNIDYIKQVKFKCHGGYIIDNGIHKIKDTMFG